MARLMGKCMLEWIYGVYTKEWWGFKKLTYRPVSSDSISSPHETTMTIIFSRNYCNMWTAGHISSKWWLHTSPAVTRVFLPAAACAWCNSINISLILVKYLWIYTRTKESNSTGNPLIYRVSRGECARLRENVPYVKVQLELVWGTMEEKVM